MQLSIILLLLLVLYIVFTSENKWEAFKIIISAGAIALFIRTFFFQDQNNKNLIFYNFF